MAVKVNDNEKIPKERLEGIGSLVRKISDKTLEQLSKEGVFFHPERIKDSKDMTKDQMVLQSVNEHYRTSNVMGFLGYGKQHLIIRSRFSSDDQDHFFQYLLEKVMDFPNVLELSTNMSREDRLFNMLLFLFPQYLKKAMRKGAYKTYIRRQYNNADIKGSVNIARHIRENTPFVGKVAYDQREFSYDNHLMQLIRHTIEFIKMVTYGKDLLHRCKDEVSAVVKATSDYEYYNRRKIITQNKTDPIRHAYYFEYRELQRLCLMILQYEKHRFGSGSREIYGILFDGAWLWEEYVDLLIGKDFYHPTNKSGGGGQRLFDNKEGLIYPDFISSNSEDRLIADAKYKPIHNIRGADYLQMLAYMMRFDAKRGSYLYPDNDGSEKMEMRLNSGSTYEKNVVPRDDISVIKLGLKIPRFAEDHEHFRRQMAASEEKFKAQLAAYF